MKQNKSVLQLAEEFNNLIVQYKYNRQSSLDYFKKYFNPEMVSLVTYGYSVLQQVVMNCNNDIVKYVLTYPYIDVNFQSSVQGATVFQIVANEQCFSLKKALLLLEYDRFNINTSLVDDWNNNPIYSTIHNLHLFRKNDHLTEDYYVYLQKLHDVGFKLNNSAYSIVQIYDDYRVLDIFKDTLPYYEYSSSDNFVDLVEKYRFKKESSLDYFKLHFTKDMLNMDYYGYSVIQIFLKCGSIDIVKYLLNTYGPSIDLNYQHPYYGTTIFQIISKQSLFNYNLASFLLNYSEVDTALLDIFGTNPANTALSQKPRPFQKSPLEEDYYKWLQDLHDVGFPRTKYFTETANRLKDVRSKAIFKRKAR